MLAKIRQALTSPAPEPFPDTDMHAPLYTGAGDDLAVTFAENFIRLQGQFSYCADLDDLRSQLKMLMERKEWHRVYCANEGLKRLLQMDWYDELASCNAAITGCEALVARTGSIVLSAAQAKGRTASVYAPAHICVAYSSQLLPDVSHALDWMHRKYKGQLPSMISFANGPSRTADIEKTLVTGVHGPREVFCFLVEG